MYGDKLVYVALVVDDVEAAAAMWEKDFGLVRSEHTVDGGTRRVPLLSVGSTALALFAQGDQYVGRDTHTGVHHLALGVADTEAAADAALKAGVGAETGRVEASLDGTKRVLLSLEATNGVKTYLATEIERPSPRQGGYVSRIDHLGIVGTDNQKVVDVYCRQLGCRFSGEQVDTEIQAPVEHFVYKSNRSVRTVVHNRPAEFVAAVHDVFITTGDCELEIIQVLDTSTSFRASAERPGNTKQDHGALARFLAVRGPGLHHLAFKVDAVDPALERLYRTGHRMIDRIGRPGARCSKIGFLHPKSTGGVLTHLVERDDSI